MRPSPMLTYHRRPPPSVARFIVKEVPPALLLNRPSSLHRQNRRHLLVRERTGFLHLLRLAYLFSPPPLATKPHQPILLGPSLSTFPRSSMSTDCLRTSWRTRLKSTLFRMRRSSNCLRVSACCFTRKGPAGQKEREILVLIRARYSYICHIWCVD